MNYKGKFCERTYFGSGNVKIGVIGPDEEMLLPTRVSNPKDNGFCVIYDAEWDDLPAGCRYIHSAHPPGNHFEEVIG